MPIPLKIMKHKHSHKNFCWSICTGPCLKQEHCWYKKCRTFLYNPSHFWVDLAPLKNIQNFWVCTYVTFLLKIINKTEKAFSHKDSLSNASLTKVQIFWDRPQKFGPSSTLFLKFVKLLVEDGPTFWCLLRISEI